MPTELTLLIFEMPGGEPLRTKGRYAEWDVLISRLEDQLEGLHPELAIDHLRQDISRHCLEGAARARGTYSLTVPTGGGRLSPAFVSRCTTRERTVSIA